MGVAAAAAPAIPFRRTRLARELALSFAIALGVAVVDRALSTWLGDQWMASLVEPEEARGLFGSQVLNAAVSYVAWVAGSVVVMLGALRVLDAVRALAPDRVRSIRLLALGTIVVVIAHLVPWPSLDGLALDPPAGTGFADVIGVVRALGGAAEGLLGSGIPETVTPWALAVAAIGGIGLLATSRFDHAVAAAEVPGPGGGRALARALLGTFGLAFIVFGVLGGLELFLILAAAEGPFWRMVGLVDAAGRALVIGSVFLLAVRHRPALTARVRAGGLLVIAGLATAVASLAIGLAFATSANAGVAFSVEAGVIATIVVAGIDTGSWAPAVIAVGLVALWRRAAAEPA
jgi:hypothetical protein